jgi:hypothetical protein
VEGIGFKLETATSSTPSRLFLSSGEDEGEGEGGGWRVEGIGFKLETATSSTPSRLSLSSGEAIYLSEDLCLSACKSACIYL